MARSPTQVVTVDTPEHQSGGAAVIPEAETRAPRSPIWNARSLWTIPSNSQPVQRLARPDIPAEIFPMPASIFENGQAFLSPPRLTSRVYARYFEEGWGRIAASMRHQVAEEVVRPSSTLSLAHLQTVISRAQFELAEDAMAELLRVLGVPNEANHNMRRMFVRRLQDVATRRVHELQSGRSGRLSEHRPNPGAIHWANPVPRPDIDEDADEGPSLWLR